MDIITFTTLYSEDLEFHDMDYDQHLNRLEQFHKRTHNYHKSVKKSYFETSKSYIGLRDFHGIRKLAVFHNAYLFDESDEKDLLSLIRMTSGVLTSLSESDLQWALDYLYYMLDYMFHEHLYATTGAQLLKSFEELENAVQSVIHLDHEGGGQLVLDKIGLIRFMEK